MKNATLKAYKVGKIIFNNNIEGSVQLNLSDKVSHNVKYSSNGMCEASLTVFVRDDKQPKALNVEVTVKGLFEINTEIEKEFIHVETFNELFPYAKALITNITANAGIAPVIIRNVNIEDQEIYRFGQQTVEE